MPVLLVMTLVIIDLARGYALAVMLQEGARQSARYGSTAANASPTITDADLRQRLINGASPALEGCSSASSTCTNSYGTFTFTVSPATRSSGTQLVTTVTGSMPLLIGYLTGFIGVSTISLTGTATMVVV
jgi:Flp pilus assembly protein TadG